MHTTDPIADMLSRIRNAIAVRKSEVEMPHSNLKETVARILADNSFISDVSVAKADRGKSLKIIINDDESSSSITEIVRMSTPGRRLYVGSKDIPTVKRGRGIVVISTSKGVMTGKEARDKHLGGELICKVY